MKRHITCAAALGLAAGCHLQKENALDSADQQVTAADIRGQLFVGSSTRSSALGYGMTAIAEFQPYPGFTGEIRLAHADLNGDGRPDLVTAPGPGGGPHIRAFDAVTGVQLPGPIGSFFAYNSNFHGGIYIALGDVNDDGKNDVITGADAGGGPHVRVFSGATGGLLHDFFAYNSAFTGGVRVASGDVNGDGADDIITAAGPTGGPHIIARDGKSLAVLDSYFAYGPLFGGGVYVAAGDFNGDGRADIVTGAGAGGGPHVRVRDGATRAFIGDFFAFEPSFTGGVRVGVSDADGDGLIELVTGRGPGAAPESRGFAIMPNQPATPAERWSLISGAATDRKGVHSSLGKVR